MEWTQAYARALARAADGRVNLSPDDEEAVLLLARLVAHATERRNAPVATFLAGWFVGDRVAAGMPAGEALAEATTIAEGLLDPEGRPAT